MAIRLEGKATIPQVAAKMQLIKMIGTDDFWKETDVLGFEKIRKEIRDLIKFIIDDDVRAPIITHLTDPVIERDEGRELGTAYDFEDYRKKVNRYVEENGNNIVIHKFKNNLKLTKSDYEELERVLTKELGSKEDYEREYGDIPFGLLIRQIGKLDHDAAMKAFSRFINDASLNQKQIAFVEKIINHVEQNGYMEDVSELLKPPFDKPQSFIKIFDNKTRAELVDTLKVIRENAIEVIA